MPAYAFLNTPLYCPGCRTKLDDQVWFQWGFCIDRAQRPESTYVVGDAIRWHACGDGRILAWTYLYRGDQTLGANIGTPGEPDVVVRDWTNTQHEGPCPRCGVTLGSTAVEIRGGNVVRGWITRAGELPPGDAFRIRSDGTLEVLVAGDSAMAIARDC